MVCLTLIAILFLVSIFIISNTIKLTTFDRREEIAIMRMVGATNGFIRWPFVYEGFMIGLLSAVIAFGLQWILYAAVAKGVANSDTLKLIHVVDFTTFWWRRSSPGRASSSAWGAASPPSGSSCRPEKGRTA